MRLALPPPPTHPRDSSLSQPSCFHDFPNLHTTVRSIQKEQASSLAYVEMKHALLWGFVQERHDEFRGMIASQNQYFQDFRTYLGTWRDLHVS